MKKYLLILLFLASCGYQPVFVNKSLKNLAFTEITVQGDKKIGNDIINFLNIKKSNITQNQNELVLNSKFTTSEIGKNSKGEILYYQTKIDLIFQIRKDNKIIEEKLFNDEYVYDNKENKYELTKYQEEVKNNLVKNIVEDIVFYLNLR